jgi:hypothetical protein
MVLQCGATDRGLVEALAGFGIDIETAMPALDEKCRAEPRFDDLVPMSLGIVVRNESRPGYRSGRLSPTHLTNLPPYQVPVFRGGFRFEMAEDGGPNDRRLLTRRMSGGCVAD